MLFVQTYLVGSNNASSLQYSENEVINIIFKSKIWQKSMDQSYQEGATTILLFVAHKSCVQRSNFHRSKTVILT